MYTKPHRNTNRKIISSPTPIPAPLCGNPFTFSFQPQPSLFHSVSYDWGVHVDNHLDHKVLLDLGVLQTTLVGQELAGEEPPLAGHVNLLLLLQLLLELGNGVRHASCQTHILSWETQQGEVELTQISKHAVRKLWIIHRSPVCMRQDAIKCSMPGERCISCSLLDWNVTLFMYWRSHWESHTCWQSHPQLELLPAWRGLSLFLCGFRNFALSGCLGDEVDRWCQSVRRELVTVPQFIITLRERACRGRDDLWEQIFHQILSVSHSYIHPLSIYHRMHETSGLYNTYITFRSPLSFT